MKRKHVVIIGVIAIILIMIDIAILMKRENKKSDVENDAVVIAAKDVVYDNGWIKQYISEIKDDIPIPTGYEYMQGDIETGFVIKDSEENYYMWIPYNEEANVENIDEYFNCTAYADYEATNSMKKHGGFYALLTNDNNEISNLKNFNEETYKAKNSEIEEKSKNETATNKHLISREELKQMLFYTNLKGINELKISSILGANGGDGPRPEGPPSGAKPEEQNVGQKSTLNENKNQQTHTDEETSEKVSKMFAGTTALNIENWNKISEEGKQKAEEKGYYFIKFQDDENKQIKFPVPYGFTWENNNNIKGYDSTLDSNNKAKIFKIRNINNPNLVYVWVSTDGVVGKNDDIPEAIKKYFLKGLDKFNTDNSTDFKYALENIKTVIGSEVDYSIKTFNGFYVSQGEVWKDNQGSLGTNTTATENFNNNTVRVSDVNEAIEIANGILQDNKNVLSIVTPLFAQELVRAKVAEDFPTEMFAKSETKVAENSPKNQTIEEVKEYIGFVNLNGSVKEIISELTDASGNKVGFLGDDNNFYNINEYEITYYTNNKFVDNVTIMGDASYKTSGDVKLNGFGPGGIGMEEKVTKDDTGVRTCLFLTDINRHSQYFELKDVLNLNRTPTGQKYASLKTNVTIPERIVVPEKIFDPTDNQQKTFEYVLYNENEKIKEINDQISTKIKTESFAGCKKLQTVDMKDIEEIPKEAFKGLENLREVNINSKGTIIAEGAFEGCKNLTTVSLTYVDAIRDCAFYNCTGLKSISMNYVLHIGASAFEGCEKLEKFNVSNKYDIGDYGNIGEYAFKNCNKLVSIIIGTQGEIPQGEIPQGEMPQGEMPQGEMPQGEMPQGEMPQGGMPQGEMPQGGMSQGGMPQNNIEGLQKGLQDFESVALNAFENCEILEKIAIGKISNGGLKTDSLNETNYYEGLLGEKGLFKKNKALKEVIIKSNEFKAEIDKNIESESKKLITSITLDIDANNTTKSGFEKLYNKGKQEFLKALYKNNDILIIKCNDISVKYDNEYRRIRILDKTGNEIESFEREENGGFGQENRETGNLNKSIDNNNQDFSDKFMPPNK